MEKTLVEVTCTSKKQTQSYKPDQPSHEIELSVPYDQSSIFYQMSGGTVMKLNTINQEAAAMFVIGNVYEMSIKPKEVAPAEEKTEA